MNHLLEYEIFRDRYNDENPRAFRHGEDPYDFSSRFKLSSPKPEPEEWPELEEEDPDEEMQKSIRLKKYMAKHKQDPSAEPESPNLYHDTSADRELHKQAIAGMWTPKTDPRRKYPSLYDIYGR